MLFYVIKPHSQPEIIFACSTRNPIKEHTSNIIDHREGIIEILYHDSVDLKIECEKSNLILPPGSISLYMPDCKYRVAPIETQDKNFFTESTVAVSIKDMDYICFDETSHSKIYEIMEQYPDSMILPQVYLARSGGTRDEDETLKVIQAKIKFLISNYRDKSARGKYSCLSQWYDICSEIDFGFRNLISSSLHKEEPITSSGYYYMYKTQKYVNAHIKEVIDPIDVSKNVGLKHDYFVRMFKKEKGISLNEYIYRLKVQNLCVMIERHPTRSLKTLVGECGFTDFRYTQRLFKKYVGMSMSDYKRLGNGLTLYHENPWLREEISEDIFKKEGEESPTDI